MSSPPRTLITAGPTHEPVDAVRYLGNRSSGRLGLALAEAARDAGDAVRLLLGPVEKTPPEGVAVDRFESTKNLETLLSRHFPHCDRLIMAAAVADYRPVHPTDAKVHRAGGRWSLEVEATPDLLRNCAERKRSGQRIVGFALEAPETLEARAADKLAGKGLDAVVANPLGSMGSDRVRATVLTASGRRLEPGAMPKEGFARWLIRWLSE